jgi:hypothetical protein
LVQHFADLGEIDRRCQSHCMEYLMMTRSRWIVATTSAALFAIACGSTTPTTPSRSSEAAVTSNAALAANAGADCAVDVGTTANPLPALHELEGWLNTAIADASSDLNCGQVRSLDAKLEAVAKALDQTPPKFHEACGASGALVNEIEALVNRGELGLPTFPPPFPGGPTDVLAAARGLHDRWCAAARGEIEGPRS